MKSVRYLAAALCGLMLASSLAAAPAPIPFNTEPSVIETHGLRVLIALGVLTVVALGVARWLKSARPDLMARLKPASPTVRVVGRARLTTRCNVFVLDYRGRELLVAVSGDRVVELGGAAPQIDAGQTAMTEQDGGHG
jgi:flagellar biogenesis protein FliO